MTYFGRQAKGNAGLLEHFDQQEEIRRSRSRQRRDRIHLRFLIEPKRRADCTENRLRQRSMSRGDIVRREQAGHPTPLQRRAIRHAAHDSGSAAPTMNVRSADAGSDGDQQRRMYQ
jgi:hypothetical protein